MTINLKCELTRESITRIQTTKLLTGINKINIYNEFNFNTLIIPIRVYNIIEGSEFFLLQEEKISSNLRKLGSISNFECYLDIYLNNDEIKLTCDEGKLRDLKIENLLNNKEFKTEIKVKLIY